MFYQKSLPSRELTYPTWGKGKSSSKMPFLGDMLVPWRVYSWVGCHPFFCCPTQRPGFCCGSTEPNYPPLGPPNGQAHLGRCVSGNVTITYAVETGAPVLFPGFLVIPWFLFHILLRKHQSTPPWRNPHRWSEWWRPTSWDAQIKRIQSTRSNNIYTSKTECVCLSKIDIAIGQFRLDVVDFGKTSDLEEGSAYLPACPQKDLLDLKRKWAVFNCVS